MSFKCAFCNARVPINPNYDTSTCPGCGQVLANGLDKKFRKILERPQYWMKRPKSVLARAASYSNRIYKFSTEGKDMDLIGIEVKIANRFGPEKAGRTVNVVYTAGRGALDMTDQAIGVALITVDGVTSGTRWRYVYVVFRGSTGDHTQNGSGWDDGTDTVNLDWRMDFENDQASTLWGPPGARVHQGFRHMYLTMRTNLKIAVSRAMRDTPPGTTCLVIVCGHSLGAGLSQVCAHDFNFSGLARACCFPMSPPRAGNLAFVRSFNIAMCDAQIFYPSEGQSHTMAVSSIQGIDPVSSEMARGAKMGIMPEDTANWVDTESLIKHGAYLAGFGHTDVSKELAEEERLLYGKVSWGFKRKRKRRWEQSKAIYYHIKNIWRIQLTGFHHPGAIEKNAYSTFH